MNVYITRSKTQGTRMSTRVKVYDFILSCEFSHLHSFYQIYLAGVDEAISPNDPRSESLRFAA